MEKSYHIGKDREKYAYRKGFWKYMHIGKYYRKNKYYGNKMSENISLTILWLMDAFRGP